MELIRYVNLNFCLAGKELTQHRPKKVIVHTLRNLGLVHQRLLLGLIPMKRIISWDSFLPGQASVSGTVSPELSAAIISL